MGTDNVTDHALGALAGLAVGDALGMPTQMLSREMVSQIFPELEWFEAGPPANWISAGQVAGRVTDDTEQAFILGRLLLKGNGHVDPAELAEAFVEWGRLAEADGSEQLGPSTRKALAALADGTPPGETGRSGSTNGAAMRIAPVGVASSVDDLDQLVDRVEEACLVTHHTGIAVAGAAAVAAAVSAGVERLPFDDTLAVSYEAARRGGRRGHYVAGANVARRLQWAVELVSELDEDAALDAVSELIGTGVQTEQAVPAAFALFACWRGDPWTVCLQAARLGGDSDTVGAIAGAVSGAYSGVSSFPEAAVQLVEDVNGLDIATLAHDLLSLREAPPRLS